MTSSNILVLFLILALILSWTYFAYLQTSSQPTNDMCIYVASPGPSTPVYTLSPSKQHNSDVPMQQVVNRDNRVLQDPLYPPVSRQDVAGTVRLMEEPRLQPISKTSLYESDRYRLVGYLINPTDKTDVWKLFARDRDGGRRADGLFYVTSANKNVDLKIPLTSEMIDGRPLRDLYDLPESVKIKHPMFAQVPYTIAALPNSDLQDMASGYF